MQTNAKVPLEQSTLQEDSTQIHFRETSTDKLEAEIINPKLVLPKIKSTTVFTNSLTNKCNRSLSIPAFIYIPPVPEVKFSVSQNSEEHILYPDSTPVGSPVYISCKSKEPSPHFPSPPFLNFSSPNDQFPEAPLNHPEVTKR
jgi:hypothetical protein